MGKSVELVALRRKAMARAHSVMTTYLVIWLLCDVSNIETKYLRFIWARRYFPDIDRRICREVEIAYEDHDEARSDKQWKEVVLWCCGILAVLCISRP